MGNDREWAFDLVVAILAAPFILLEKLLQPAGRAVTWVVRNPRTKVVKRIGALAAFAVVGVLAYNLGTALRGAFGDDPVAIGIVTGVCAAAVLLSLASEVLWKYRPEGSKREVVSEPEWEDSDSHESRVEKKEALEASYARLKEDERERLADESMPEEERREWENFYAQKKRELREEIRKWI